jgi:hypothetical protein
MSIVVEKFDKTEQSINIFQIKKNVLLQDYASLFCRVHNACCNRRLGCKFRQRSIEHCHDRCLHSHRKSFQVISFEKYWLILLQRQTKQEAVSMLEKSK